MAMNMEAMLRIRANVTGENNIRRLGNSMQGVQGQVKNLAMSFDGLRAAVGGLAGLVGGGLIINKIFGDAATLESQARSLQVLTGSATQASQIIRELQSYGALTPFESTELIETAKRLNAFGVDSSRVVDVVKTLGDVAGATGANLGELATAYGQVVAKGRLQGEELLQFQERGVALSAELQKMYKLQGQEFTKALEGGRISAEAVEVAIQRLTAAGGKYADGAIAQSDTLNGKFSTLKDNITGLSQTIGTVLGPAVKAILDLAINVIDTINKAIKLAISGPQQAEATASVRAGQLPFGGPAAIDRIIGEQRRRALQRQAGSAFLGFGFNEKNFIKLLQQQPEFAVPKLNRASLPATPALLPARGEGKKEKSKKNEEVSQKIYQLELDLLEAQRKENETQVASIKYEIAQQKFAESKLKNRNDLVELAKAERQYMEDIADIATKTGAAVAQDFIKRNQLQEDYKRTVEELQIKAGLITGDKLKQVEIDRELQTILERLPGLTQAQIDKLKELVAASKQVKDGFGDTFGESLRQYYDSLKNFGGQVADSVKGAFQGLEDQLTSFVTTGKANFTDLANSIIADIARIAIRQAIIRPLVGGIFDIFNIKPSAMGNVFAQNGIQKFARGGIVDKPTMFPFAKGIGLMGEAGPEGILPLSRGRDGRLGVQATNGGGGVSVVVNVDASGTSVQGDNAKGAEFGRAISEAVKNEIVIQKRPGGLLN
jgi:lambda family phage tail tape measure protein